MKIQQAYRFALDPAPAQERALRSHAGASRFAWNWGLAKCTGRYEAEGRWYSAADLHKIWNAEKKQDPDLAWWPEREIPGQHARPGSAAGIDLGVKTLLTGADDTGRVITVPGQKPLRAAFRKLRRASRECSRKQPGSANRRKGAAKLARVHARVANVRADALRKATTALAREYETVAVEDLNVAGMTRNRKLARAVSDQGFGQARRMLGYKTAWNGGTLVVAGRWFPSSKACSSCGSVKAKLTLAERTFACETCGHTEDRDVNAARNLLNLAASGAESRNACGGTVRPGLAGHVPVKQEPGIPNGSKAGTAAPQGTAAT